MKTLSTWFRHLLLATTLLLSQPTGVLAQDYSKYMTIQVTARVSTAPAPQIVLSWPNRTADFIRYSLQRKATGTTTVYTTLPNTATGYIDTNVIPGLVYEYKINATSVNRDNPVGYGTISAAVEAPAIHSQGTLLMVVASDVHAGLAFELSTYRNNLRGEGWNVAQVTVNPTDSVAAVKATILAQVAAASVPVKSLILVGHVPVPYSGNLNPDAHPEHRGAWPCDGYYGDLHSEVWTDTTVNTVTNSVPPMSSRNINVPGDGKFDQSTFPGVVELCVGRVDFHDLPAFTGKTHLQLLKAYFS